MYYCILFRRFRHLFPGGKSENPLGDAFSVPREVSRLCSVPDAQRPFVGVRGVSASDRPDAVQPRDEEFNAEDPVIGQGKSLSPQPARDSALLELELEHELDLMTKHLTSAGEQSLSACKKQRVSPLGGTEFVVFDRRLRLVHKMGTICDNQWVFTGHALQMHVLPNFVPQCRQLHRALMGGTDCGST